jgi:hypothetical protein
VGILSVEAVNRWEPGYWAVRGWDREAVMKATSVIDTVASGSERTGRAQTIMAGGIAHAGVRGISRVELQVDGGDWHEPNCERRCRTPRGGSGERTCPLRPGSTC